MNIFNSHPFPVSLLLPSDVLGTSLDELHLFCHTNSNSNSPSILCQLIFSSTRINQPFPPIPTHLFCHTHLVLSPILPSDRYHRSVGGIHIPLLHSLEKSDCVRKAGYRPRIGRIMDTPSSSSSSSAPTRGQQISQQPTYTTVGSVYNPQVSAPLQPPARRSRALRWPPAVPTDLASFQKIIQTSFSNRGFRSPPTTASTLKHYSPLQQNHDRAVNPSILPPNQERSSSQSSNTLSSNKMPSPGFPPGLGSLQNDNSRLDGNAFLKDGDTKEEDGEEEEEEELARMSNYSVKTLTSLASYPNPHQKMAQRALDRARETFKAASENLRPITPSSYRQGFDGAGTQIYAANLTREKTEDVISRVPRYGHMHSSTRSSVLSSGPGAPQPLTAGPPGQRQYKASTMEGTFRALQASIQKTLPSEVDESQFDINPSSLVNFGMHSFTKLPSPQRQAPDQQNKLLRQNESFNLGRLPAHNTAAAMGFPTSARPHIRVRDTKPLNYLKQYYPHGPPPGYDPTALTSVPEDNSDLLPPRSHFLPHTIEAQKQRDNRHRAAFYSGTDDLLKDLDERFDEIRKELWDRELGVGDSSNRATAFPADFDVPFNSSRLGKPLEISIEDVNQLQTHEAANPLLNMAYSTLARYWDNGHLLKTPMGFEKVQKPQDEHK